MGHAMVDKAARRIRSCCSTRCRTNAYKFSWLLIPISVPFLWLLFPFSRRYHLYDHTVFVTYSLSFMMMLVIVSSVGSAPHRARCCPPFTCIAS